MTRKTLTLVLALIISGVGLTASPALAGTQGDQAVAVAPAAADIATARQMVADGLRSHGLSEQEVQQRLDRLTDQDLQQLSQHVAQIQEGGAPPNYIWTLLGVFLVVAIVAAVL